MFHLIQSFRQSLSSSQMMDTDPLLTSIPRLLVQIPDRPLSSASLQYHHRPLFRYFLRSGQMERNVISLKI